MDDACSWCKHFVWPPSILIHVLRDVNNLRKRPKIIMRWPNHLRQQRRSDWPVGCWFLLREETTHLHRAERTESIATWRADDEQCWLIQQWKMRQKTDWRWVPKITKWRKTKTSADTQMLGYISDKSTMNLLLSRFAIYVVSFPLACSLEFVNSASRWPMPSASCLNIAHHWANWRHCCEQWDAGAGAGIHSLVSQNVKPCYFLFVTVSLLAECSNETDISDACPASITNSEYNK